MPVYEFECQSCKEITEIWQGISEEPLAACPGCNGPVKKIISASTFALKGGGWYADGYSRTSGKGESCAAATPATPCGKTEKSSCGSC
jgi:putative FmdB family regulatory protein